MLAEPEGNTVGTVDEDFAVESLAGDIFLLGTRHGEFAAFSAGAFWWKTRMAPRPNVPFWRGEAPARTAELSAQVAALRDEDRRR